ncbi:MAG TPA: hypothetical protein VFB82_08005 [Blastocatellia bacterium]|nr:hypothetical protein [Blastocatellia bacterium]
MRSAGWSKTAYSDLNRDPIAAALRELVDALDRREAHLERLGGAPEAAAKLLELLNRYSSRERTD